MRKIISNVLIQFNADKCTAVAAELTLTSLLAFVPLLTLFFTILSMIPNYQTLGGEIQSLVFDYFAPSASESVQTYLAEFVSKAKSMSWLGFIMLFITALMMMRTIDRSFNHIWKIKHKHSTVRTFLVYWAILTLGPLLLGTSLVVTSYLKSVELLSDVVQVTSGWLTLGLPFLLEFITFTLMFFIIPNRKIVLKNALLAAVVTTILFEIAKFGFSMFIQYFSTYQLIFGALASIPLFLIWLYLSWSIILLGAELCHALFFSEINSLTRQNKLINAILLLQDFANFKSVSLNSENMECLEQLSDQNIIARLDDQSFRLIRTRSDLTYQLAYDISGRVLPTAEEIQDSELDESLKQQLLILIESYNQSFNHVISFQLS